MKDKLTLYNIKVFDTSGKYIPELDCNLIQSEELAEKISAERFKISYVGAVSTIQHGCGGFDIQVEEHFRLNELAQKMTIEKITEGVTSLSGITYKMKPQDKPRPQCEDPM